MEDPKIVVSLGIIGLLALLSGSSVEAAPKKRILVLCTGNSARSQMAEALLRAVDSRLEVYSAGTQPSARVSAYAVRVMKELGIDISKATPKSVTQFLGQSFDYVITVCDDADRACPTFSGRVGTRLHIGFPDPAKANGTDAEVLAVFQRVRDQIRAKFVDYYAKEIKTSL